jgi:hypothetical protein
MRGIELSEEVTRRGLTIETVNSETVNGLIVALLSRQHNRFVSRFG